MSARVPAVRGGGGDGALSGTNGVTSGSGNCAAPTQRRKNEPRCTQPPTPTQHGREVSADARRVVQLLLRDEVVDGALRAEGLAVRDLQSAAAPASRSDLDQRPACAFPTGADRAAAVIA